MFLTLRDLTPYGIIHHFHPYGRRQTTEACFFFSFFFFEEEEMGAAQDFAGAYWCYESGAYCSHLGELAAAMRI